MMSRTQLHSSFQRRLAKAQVAMERTANSHRRDVHFDVGDWVFVRLRPYRQTSLQSAYSKLSKRFYGPFCILERIGPVAYRLQLPTSSKIHIVFHVSLLKPYRGDTPTTLDPLPPLQSDNHPVVEPLSILDWKWDTNYTPPVQKVLVQWTGLAPEDTTWEDWDSICTSYNLGDKVVLLEEGIGSKNNPTSSRPTRAHRKPTYLLDYE